MAPGEHLAPNAPVSRQTLWLSVRLSHENWLFEIEPDEERAIVVGSLLRAHVRINRRDVAPVHFHFERERDRIRVCPAYGADLCVNGTRVSGPHELEGHATLGFAGLELEAYVCDIEPNILEQLDLRDWTADERPDCGAVFSLPDGGEVTRAIPRLSVAPEARADETKKYEPLCETYLQEAGVQSGSRKDECDWGRASTLPPEASIRGSAVVSVDAASTNHDSEPTLPGIRPAARGQDFRGAAPELELALDDFPSTAPVCSDAANESVEPWNWPLTRLGLAARRQPLVVTLAAAGGAVLLSLAMLAMDQLVMHRSLQAPHTARVSAATSPAVPISESSAPSSGPSRSEVVPEVSLPVSQSSNLVQAPKAARAAGSSTRMKRPGHPPPSATAHAIDSRSPLGLLP